MRQPVEIVLSLHKVCLEGKCDVNVIHGKRMSSASVDEERLRSRTGTRRVPMSVMTNLAFFYSCSKEVTHDAIHTSIGDRGGLVFVVRVTFLEGCRLGIRQAHVATVAHYMHAETGMGGCAANI